MTACTQRDWFASLPTTEELAAIEAGNLDTDFSVWVEEQDILPGDEQDALAYYCKRYHNQ